MANTVVNDTDPADDFQFVLAEQRAEQPTQNDTVVTTFAALQSEELMKTELELADSDQAKLEMRKTREELNRLIHDQMFAKELSSIPDDEWSERGGNFEKPYGEGTSKSVVDSNDCEFRLYC